MEPSVQYAAGQEKGTPAGLPSEFLASQAGSKNESCSSTLVLLWESTTTDSFGLVLCCFHLPKRLQV